MPKFSENVIHNAINFIRVVESEMGSLGQDKVFAMLDAFDPDLRNEIFMTLFIADDTVPMNVYVRKNPMFTGQYQKINAIRAIRQASGYGLKQAKDVTDAADLSQIALVEVVGYEKKRTLINELVATGYEVV
jgi:ribosomal protein L7/L12